MGKFQPSISRFFQSSSPSVDSNDKAHTIDLTDDTAESHQPDARESPLKRKLLKLEEFKSNADEEKENEKEQVKEPATKKAATGVRGRRNPARSASKKDLSTRSPQIEEPAEIEEVQDVVSDDERGVLESDEGVNASKNESLSVTPEKAYTPTKAEPVRRKSQPTKKSSKSKEPPSLAKLTPLEKSAVDFKLKNSDKILAIQVGYKFKFFGPDAAIVSRILNIMLVPGRINIDEESAYDRIAYCSIPDNRLHVHLQRILNLGYKVGVIKQTETAAIKSVDGNKNSLFERKLTAVYTKATYMDDEMITMGAMGQKGNGVAGDRGRYIFCINEVNSSTNLGSAMISFVAVSPLTGEIVYETFADGITRSELETRLIYLCPSEILVIANEDGISKEIKKVTSIALQSTHCNIIHKRRKQKYEYTAELTEFFKEYPALAEFYLAHLEPDIQSCIAELIDYLKEFKLSNIFTLGANENRNIQKFSDSKKYMILPSNTLQQLEIFETVDSSYGNQGNQGKGSLIWIMDHTRTKMGERLLNRWISKPLIDKDEICARLNSVESLISTLSSHFFETFVKQIVKISGVDFEKCLVKVHYSATYKIGKISRKEIYLFLKSNYDLLQVVSNFENTIKELFQGPWKNAPMLQNMFSELLKLSKTNTLPDLLEMINGAAALDETDLAAQKVLFFRSKWDEVEEIQLEINALEESLAVELQKVRKLLKKPQLNYVTNMKESHLIEVRNGNMVKSLPLDWIKINSTKTVSRFRTPEISKLLKMLNYQNDLLIQASDNAYASFLSKVDEKYDYFTKVNRCLSEFDCLASLTLASTFNTNFTKPEFIEYSENIAISVKEGRNPIIESLQSNSRYINNDIDMSYDEARCLIITGPNMGGKSSYVRQVALIVIMAQVGCFVPCDSARLSVFDSIFTRMGAQDNIIKGESTFMVEMSECCNIIKSCTPRSLVILDEIGRGTGTTDGISIAYAILDFFITQSKALTLFITHYPSLSIFENIYKGLVANFHMGYEEHENEEQELPEISFTYELVKGVVTNSYGLNVARLAGIPNEIVSQAYKKSIEIKTNVERDESIKFALELSKILHNLDNGENSDSQYSTLKSLSMGI